MSSAPSAETCASRSFVLVSYSSGSLASRIEVIVPIAVHVVSDADFTTWANAAKQKYAGDESAPPQTLAAALAPTPR